jgi:hypothetical protein
MLVRGFNNMLAATPDDRSIAAAGGAAIMFSGGLRASLQTTKNLNINKFIPVQDH